MGFFLQIVGVILAIASLIVGIVVIKTGAKSSIPVILLITGMALITIGRKMNH